jgi:hypothetical protein
VSLSIHYYVLSLGAWSTRLFEAFRDSLIDVQNQGFPVQTPALAAHPSDQGRLRELALTVDRCFGHYYLHEPLGVVVVGEEEMQSAFLAVTAHRSAVIAGIAGDHTATPARDLGQISWSAVKEGMSGVLDRAMRDLRASGKGGEKACGLAAVSRLAGRGARATLLVEEDYRMKGRLGGTSESPVISPDVDVRDVMDDAVDAVIEKVLASGGNVLFTPGGSLRDEKRIVLMLDGVERA